MLLDGAVSHFVFDHSTTAARVERASDHTHGSLRIILPPCVPPLWISENSNRELGTYVTEVAEARAFRHARVDVQRREVVIGVAKVKRASAVEPCSYSIIRWVWAVNGRETRNGRRFSSVRHAYPISGW
jgi:hypothetical protein